MSKVYFWYWFNVFIFLFILFHIPSVWNKQKIGA